MNQDARSDQMRDAMLRAMPEHGDTILDRDAVVERWCAEHGTSKDDLSIDDILAIRALPEWKEAGR